MSRDAWTPTPEQLILLRRNLTDYFSDDELRTLCSEIGIDYDRLRGASKAAKASELVRYLAGRARIPELVAHASRLRPNISWGGIPRDWPAIEPPPLSRGIRAARWLGWLVAMLIVAAGLVFVLGGGLRQSKPEAGPSPTPGTPSPAPTASARAAPTSTPMPTAAAVTATQLWTPAPPTETSTPPVATETPTPVLPQTPTAMVRISSNVPQTVTLLAPLNGACSQSPIITFKWTGATLRPGESFLVAITPSEVNRGKCTSNYTNGVQYSPPLVGYEWTTDISASPNTPTACAGPVEWTVYVRSVTGHVTLAAPIQYFEWNPLRCINK